MVEELIESESEDLGNQTSREMNTLILNRFLENEILNDIFNPVHIVKAPYRHLWLLWLVPFIALYILMTAQYWMIGILVLFLLSVWWLHYFLKNRYLSVPHSKYLELKKLVPSSERMCAMLITLGYNDYTKGVFSIKSVRSNVLRSEGDDKEMEILFIKMIEVVYPKWKATKFEILKNEDIIRLTKKTEHKLKG